MKKTVVALASLSLVLPAIVAACGSSNNQSLWPNGSDGGTGGGSGSDGSMTFPTGDTGTLNGGDGGGPSGDGATVNVCPPNAQCNVSCSSGTTTISGIVLDPAGKNPLYDVVVYVAASAVEPLPSGVPTGSSACSCSALFSGSPSAFALTDTSGKFQITNAPVGANLNLVTQVGKWRKQQMITTTSCMDTNVGNITLPKNGTEGDIPHIAVSTGSADSLECLLVRIGLDAAEYVPGWTSSTGHVHIFNGGGGTGQGRAEMNQMANAPASYATGGLWDTVDDLMKNDIVLLSCEGGETSEANPPFLEQYLNAGGRAFASHFHYAWFTHREPVGLERRTSPSGRRAAPGTAPSGGNIVTTLTSGGPFPKGQAFQQWLSNVSALGQTVLGTAVPTGELAVAEPRFNAEVTNQTPSQPWIQLDTRPTRATRPAASTPSTSRSTPR